jgi:hypothetical protein
MITLAIVAGCIVLGILCLQWVGYLRWKKEKKKNG